MNLLLLWNYLCNKCWPNDTIDILNSFKDTYHKNRIFFDYSDSQ